MMNPRVQAVVPTDEYQLQLTFTNGEVGCYDCRPLLDFGVFRELTDIKYFQRASVALGTVVWPHEQDICPDTLYEESTRIASLVAAQGAVISHSPVPMRPLRCAFKVADRSVDQSVGSEQSVILGDVLIDGAISD